MPAIQSSKMDEAHTKFCEHMNFEPDSWKSIFEFVFYVGFGVINVANRDVRYGEEIRVSDRASNAVKMLLGPHVSTIMAAYKIRRYSFTGKIRAAALWPTYVTAFIAIVLVTLILDFKESW